MCHPEHALYPSGFYPRALDDPVAPLSLATLILFTIRQGFLCFEPDSSCLESIPQGAPVYAVSPKPHFRNGIFPGHHL